MESDDCISANASQCARHTSAEGNGIAGVWEARVCV